MTKTTPALKHDEAVERAKKIDAEAWASNEDLMRDRRVKSIAKALQEQGWMP